VYNTLTTTHQTKKMCLLNILEQHVDGLMRSHRKFTDELQVQSNRRYTDYHPKFEYFEYILELHMHTSAVRHPCKITRT
jgi:hypothetical protein